MTTAIRTLGDLACELDVRTLNRAAARAERADLIDRADLRSLANRLEGRVGSTTLRAALEYDGGPTLTRSMAEERFLDLVRTGGLPRPRVNVRLEGYEVDFHWPRHRLVVEVDGYAFHKSRRMFEGDRIRDAALTAAGFRVLRLTWKQISDHGPAALVSVAQALVQSRSNSAT